MTIIDRGTTRSSEEEETRRLMSKHEPLERGRKSQQMYRDQQRLLQQLKMQQVFKQSNTRSDQRNGMLKRPFDVSSNNLPLVSTFMTNYIDDKSMMQLSRKERHLMKKERTRQQNIGSIVIGSRVKMARSEMGLPALPAPPPGRNASGDQNNLTF